MPKNDREIESYLPKSILSNVQPLDDVEGVELSSMILAIGP